MIVRIVSGVAVLAAVTGAVYAGNQLPQQDPAAAQGTTVSVTPARQDIACPGLLVTPSGGTGTDPELGGGATDATSQTFLAGETRDVGQGTASDAVVGSAVERVGGGDITGLAALTCSAPLTDQWLVGGATSVGSSARLLLANPSAASVEATVSVYGSLGELETRVVSLGPDAQTEVLLEGVVVDVASLAVHITATGTGVVAVLQDSRLDGFQPAGTDWVVASAVATDVVIPGVGTDGSSAQTATVRIMAPEGATARLTLSTADGETLWEGVNQLELEPGVVVEVAVPAVDVATAVISADAEVIAGAYITRSRAADIGVEGDTARESRWLPAQLAADDNERAIVTVGYGTRVAVYAQQGGTFTLTDAGGGTVASVELGEGETAVVPVAVPAGTQLMASGRFAWTVLLTSGEFISAMAPIRTTVDDREIAVELERYIP